MSGPDLPGYGTKTEPDDGPTCPVCDMHKGQCEHEVEEEPLEYVPMWEHGPGWKGRD